MSTSRSSNAASAAAGTAGRGNDSDAEPKTKKQRLAGASAAPENEEDQRQKAVSMVFGGELYAKLLGYGGREAILHLRDDDQWRKAMDELPADDLKSLKLPVVPRPSNFELSLLREILTGPLKAPSALPNTKLGWTLSDLGRRTLANSPLASNKMLQNLVRSGCDEDTLREISCRKDLGAAVMAEFIASECPAKLFRWVAKNPASSSEVLSAILVRLHESSLSNHVVNDILASIGGHGNANCFDLQFLSRNKNAFVRSAVSANPKAAALDLIQGLSRDDSTTVKRGCAKNPNAPQNILAKLSVDKDVEVRQYVALNPAAGKELLAMMASAETRSDVLFKLARNKSVSADDVFSLSIAEHCSWLAKYSEKPEVLMELVGKDDGKYEVDVACNKKTPADVLASLALSDNISVRRNVAGNENAASATIEFLMQADDDEVKWNIAANPSTPLNILEALATDEDSDVRVAVMENSASSEKLLVEMLADQANSNIDRHDLYRNKKLPLSSLVDVINKQLERDGMLEDDLNGAILSRFDDSACKYALPQGTVAALSKCKGTELREFSAQFPNLPVMDILRLVNDPDLNDVFVDLTDNHLLQVTVDKLSRLLSKQILGSDSHFEDGERWW